MSEMSEISDIIVELNEKLKTFVNDIISIGETILKKLNQEITDNYFNQIKSLFKQYQENIMNSYNNMEIKQKNEILNKKIIKFINNFQF